jgi:hypothetical protein
MGVKERPFCRFWIGPTVYTNLNGLTRPPPFFASSNCFVGAGAFILHSHHMSWKVRP